MNQGIEILLARMESHPHEFYNLHQHDNTPPGTRWDALLREATKGKFVTEEERTALQDKLSSIQGESFTKAVLQELMREGTKYVEYNEQPRYSPNPLQGVKAWWEGAKK
jgi:hypothetical protein